MLVKTDCKMTFKGRASVRRLFCSVLICGGVAANETKCRADRYLKTQKAKRARPRNGHEFHLFAVIRPGTCWGVLQCQDIEEKLQEPTDVCTRERLGCKCSEFMVAIKTCAND